MLPLYGHYQDRFKALSNPAKKLGHIHILELKIQIEQSMEIKEYNNPRNDLQKQIPDL